MTPTEATAEGFMLAFKALKRTGREAVLRKLVSDPEIGELLADSLALEPQCRRWRESFRQILLRRDIQVGLHDLQRGEVAPLNMAEIKRKARALLRARRERP